MGNYRTVKCPSCDSIDVHESKEFQNLFGCRSCANTFACWEIPQEIEETEITCPCCGTTKKSFK